MIDGHLRNRKQNNLVKSLKFTKPVFRLGISLLMIIISSSLNKINGNQDKAIFKQQINLISFNHNKILLNGNNSLTPALKTSTTFFENHNSSFIKEIFASISVILVSEIGDKTFFIAAIMSMKHPRLTVYTGAISALGLMTLLSALLGNILTQFIPRTYTYYASSFLFAIFGLKMLRESYGMTHADSNEEYEEASSSLRESEEKIEGKNEKSLEAGGVTAESDKSVIYKYVNLCRRYVSTVFLQAFILTFLAEWGDRSQISTIILGARENMFGTVLGGTIGHALCTGAAVIGGRMIAQRISVKTVTLVGAFVFLIFALFSFFSIYILE